MFTDADKAHLLFLPVIARRCRVTHDGKLHWGVLELGQGFGHEILVFHVGDRRIDAQPFADFAGIEASGIDDLFTRQRALRGIQPEFARGQAGDAGHAGMALDRGPHGPRARRHGIAGAGGINLAVRRGMRPLPESRPSATRGSIRGCGRGR